MCLHLSLTVSGLKWDYQNRKLKCMDYGAYIIESEAFKILDKHEEDRNITYILEPIDNPFFLPSVLVSRFQ